MQFKGLVFLIWRKWFVMYEDFKRRCRLMFAGINDAPSGRIPSSAITQGPFAGKGFGRFARQDDSPCRSHQGFFGCLCYE